MSSSQIFNLTAMSKSVQFVKPETVEMKPRSYDFSSEEFYEIQREYAALFMKCNYLCEDYMDLVKKIAFESVEELSKRGGIPTSPLSSPPLEFPPYLVRCK